uniref:Katanin p80 WD40 repeat-containing subunit B1-like n=1 Tax=Diabrotica virgifera virgifera TaxID=50390 RepID=A0A6P7GPC4_DIAVI
MSLSGHTTAVDCVQFNQLEELVCAGSRAGALKVWDLEAAKLVRTLNGHKYAIKCIDFHPYGDFLVSGSADSSIKMWDTRKKGVLFTYNGHKGTVNSVKFSPDGQWIATGGEDSILKIWDLRVSRVLKEFKDHMNPVTCVEFHPHEFLLASGSIDRSVNYFDLENFNLVSTESDVGAVRCLTFNPDGECLFAGTRDYLKIVGWEPNRLYDSVPVYWGRVTDVSVASNQLIGASFHLTNVQVYVVDLKKCKPFSSSSVLDSQTGPFTPNQNIRKSFSKAERPPSLKSRMLDVKTIEESTSGTDPEEESTADITNVKDYNEIFRGRSSKFIFELIYIHLCICSNIYAYLCFFARLSLHLYHLIGASFHLTNVQVYVVDLKKCKPFSSSSVLDSQTGPFTPNQNIRKSFSKAERPPSLKSRMLDVKTIEESTSGTDPEEESTADITNVKDYNEIFRGRS